MRPTTGESRRLTTFLVLTFFTGVLSAPVSSLLPVYVEATLRQPPTFTSTLLAIQMGMTGLFALVGGALADQLGQKRALVLGTLGLPLAASIFLLRDFWVLALVVVGLGITNSLSTVAGQAYLLASASARRLGGFTAYFYLGNTLGGALGNFVAGPAAQSHGFEMVGGVGVVAAVALVLVFLRFLPAPPAGPSRPPAEPRVLLRSYGRLLRSGNVRLIGLMRYLPTSFYGATGLLVPLLVFRLSHSVAVVGYYATANLLLASLTQVSVGRLIDRVGPTTPARVLTALLPALALVLALGSGTLAVVIAAGIVATSALWSMSTVIPSLVRAATEPVVQGRALGLVHLLWSAGMLTGTLVAGSLSVLNPGLPFAIFAVATVPAFLSALVFDPTRPDDLAVGHSLDDEALQA